MTPLDHYASLALFSRVVQLRSFSAAAREAGIAKSAVSRRIARLEDALGVRLLTRSTRSVTPTAEGLRVHAYASEMVAAAASATGEAGAEEGPMRGLVRVNAPVTFTQLYLAGAVAEFLTKEEAIEVDLQCDDRMVDVVEGGFDLVIRIGRLADSSLVARRIARDRLVVCASPAYLAAHGTPRSTLELSAHECLHYSLVPRAAEWRFRAAMGAASLPTHGRFSTSNGTVLARAAMAGLGLAVLPSFMVAADVREGRLVLVLEGQRRAEIGVYAVTATRRHVPARVRRLVEHLARTFGRMTWL
jgi:DNA-binding transcriptional LysR family regulator